MRSDSYGWLGRVVSVEPEPEPEPAEAGARSWKDILDFGSPEAIEAKVKRARDEAIAREREAIDLVKQRLKARLSTVEPWELDLPIDEGRLGRFLIRINSPLGPSWVLGLAAKDGYPTLRWGDLLDWSMQGAVRLCHPERGC